MESDGGDGGGGETVWDPVELAPAAFDKDPAAIAADPVVFIPMLLAAVRRLFPAAGGPLVRVAVPVLVTRDPYEAAAWGSGAAFHLGAGWADADDGFGVEGNGEGGREEKAGEGCFHHAFWSA